MQLSTKNLKGKMVPFDKAETDAYEVYQNGGWTWYVLKHYQSPDKEAANPQARVFCKVVTPYTGKARDLGDVYLHEIQGQLVSQEEVA